MCHKKTILVPKELKMLSLIFPICYASELVNLVERTVKSENCRTPKRPIYLVAESLGGCLALAVAARNPDIDLILVMANPGELQIIT